MNQDTTPLRDKKQVQDARQKVQEELIGLHRARAAVAAVVVGQDEVIDQIFTALLCGGHVLVESAPGLGKTLLVRTLGVVCGMEFSRIQFTPDLMPADITGTIMLLHDEQGKAFSQFQPGPVFAQMVLTDEINRATPKTQSALLEAMQERTVTVAGEHYELPSPFFVMATQNPIEMEGTYVLPEAQIDRFFFKVELPFPAEAALETILRETTGSEALRVEQLLTPEDILRLQALTRGMPISNRMIRAVARFVRSTQPSTDSASDEIRRYVRFGVSPRGAQSLILAAKAHALIQGRFNVSIEDLKAVSLPALRHRVQLNFEGEADGINVEQLINRLLDQILEEAV